MGRPAFVSPRAAPGRRRREQGVEGRARVRHRDARRPGGDHERRLRQPPALHLPRFLSRRVQGQREGVAADHAPPRRDRARGGGARGLDGGADRGRRRRRPRHGRLVHARRERGVSARERRRRVRVCDRVTAPTPQLDLEALAERSRKRSRRRRALRDGAGRDAGRGTVSARVADVQGAAAGGLVRGLLRDRRVARVRARVLDPDDLADADRVGRTRAGRRSLGRRAARVHARLQPLVGARRAL